MIVGSHRTQAQSPERGLALSRGERVDAQRPGEGVLTVDRLNPLTPTLSPRERELAGPIKEILVQ